MADHQYRIPIKIVNSLDASAFKKLLEKVVLKLPSRTNGQEFFTLDEREKLMTIFGLSTSDLAKALQLSCEVLQKAAFNGEKVDAFRSRLTEMQMNKPIAEAFVDVYGEHCKDLISKLKNISTSPCQLADFNYLLNVEVASSERAKLNKPTAGLQFVLKNNSLDQEKITVEMDHQQLYAFYEKLEEIQKQLDAIMS